MLGIQRHAKEFDVCTGGIVPTKLCRALKDGYAMHFWYFIKDPDFSITNPRHCWLMFDVRWLEQIDQKEWMNKYLGKVDDEMKAVIEIVNRHQVFPVYWEHQTAETKERIPTADNPLCFCGAEKAKFWHFKPRLKVWECENCKRRYQADYFSIPTAPNIACSGLATPSTQSASLA